MTGTTTFSITPDGSCPFASCTATMAGAHTVTATDGAKTATASLTVTPGSLDHLVLSPASATISAGASQAYTAHGADASGNDLGDVTAATSFSIAPDGSCTGASCTATVAGAHTVTATDSGKTGTASLGVTGSGGDLNPPPLAQGSTTSMADATSFLYSGSNPPQQGVAPGTIQPTRAAVLRGKVLDRSGAPLAGVTVTIVDHPEFGQTTSRADGGYDMAVNGGGLLRVRLAEAGLLPVERRSRFPGRTTRSSPTS